MNSIPNPTLGLETSRKEDFTVGEKDAVVIVDDGSRRQESNLMLNHFVEMFRMRTGYNIVEPAHMELAEPTIKDAFGKCVQQGASRVIVSPYFLSPGRHWKQDIPALAAEASKEHSNIPYIITAPLGLHELMVDIMIDRIKYCLRHVALREMSMSVQYVLELESAASTPDGKYQCRYLLSIYGCQYCNLESE